MDLTLISEKILDFSKEVGTKLIEELKGNMETKLTIDTKEKLMTETKNILNSYGEIYEVKGRGVYKYSKELEYPEFNKELYTGQKAGYYIMKDGNLEYDENLNEEINQKINQAKNRLLKEQEAVANSFKKEGEEYTVDELGDDEKYVFLIRKSDGEDYQEMNISDELYEQIKEKIENKEEVILKWNDGKWMLS